MRAYLKNPENAAEFACDLFVIPLYSDKKLPPSARAMDRALDKQVSQLVGSGDFSATLTETLLLPGVRGSKARHVMLLGLGERDKLQRQHWVDIAAALATALLTAKVRHIALASDFKPARGLAVNWMLQHLAAHITRSTYRYTATKKPEKNHLPQIDKLSFIGATNNSANKQALSHGIAIGEGIKLARELGDLPANICTPKYLAAQARKLGRKSSKLGIRVMGEKQMRELGMNSLLSVGAGSVEESQLIIMSYRGGKINDKPHVLVGKGITFDTGGISLKPGAKMDEMKFDMCGAASVLGAIHAVVGMDLPLNITGVIAAAENMPAGNATKPGDVVTSMAGKTIEVLNTDAEGRLVLCDALHYVKRFKPESVVDMATLTGACIVALGHHASGLMSNDDELADALLRAGEESGDRAWRLPLWEEYHKQLKTPFADLANIGGPSAGTITAGCFLAQFAEDYRWAHIDIAGTAWNQPGPKGASGRPVALLCQYLDNLARS